VGPATIAWLSGTNRGDLHAPASAEEIKQRLEYLRSEGNVDVYRDKTTGKELYVGRTESRSDQDKTRHNELYQQGCSLIEGLLILNNQAAGPLETHEQKRLEDAIPMFVEVVQINPANWPAMWLLGKAYQRLGQYEQGLAWFSRAHRVNPDHPDVAREASIAAMDLGQSTEAISFCERAIAANPNDAGLRANLALALLFSEKPAEASKIAQDALAQNPTDAITTNIVRIIDEVLSGKRPCPHGIVDLK